VLLCVLTVIFAIVLTRILHLSTSLLNSLSLSLFILIVTIWDFVQVAKILCHIVITIMQLKVCLTFSQYLPCSGLTISQQQRVSSEVSWRNAVDDRLTVAIFHHEKQKKKKKKKKNHCQCEISSPHLCNMTNNSPFPRITCSFLFPLTLCVCVLLLPFALAVPKKKKKKKKMSLLLMCLSLYDMISISLRIFVTTLPTHH
jgi:hypothetical protein